MCAYRLSIAPRYRRVPTAIGAAPPMAGPIGLTADIKVDARPVTASIHGLMGAPARSQGEDGLVCSRRASACAHSHPSALPAVANGVFRAGPGRQIADRSYYLSEVRNKISDIAGELRSMEAEITKHNEDSALYGKLERRYEETVTTVLHAFAQLPGGESLTRLSLGWGCLCRFGSWRASWPISTSHWTSCAQTRT
jgi:hypothetical protein